MRRSRNLPNGNAGSNSEARSDSPREHCEARTEENNEGQLNLLDVSLRTLTMGE